MSDYRDMSDYRELLREQWNKERRSIRITGYCISILLLLMGVCCLAWPAPSMTFVGIFASILIVALGVFEIVSYCALPILLRRAGSLICGILNIFVGILLLCSPTMFTLVTLTYLLGFLLLSFGVDLIVFAGRLKAFAVEGGGWLLFNGIVSVVAAFLFLLLPTMSAVLLNYVLAVYLLVGGLTLLIETISMKAAEK